MSDLTKSRILAFLAVFCWFLLFYTQTNIIIVASCLAFLTYPLFKIIYSKFNMWVSVGIYYFILFLVIIIPLTLIAILVTPQAINGYNTLLLWIDNGLQVPEAYQELLNNIYNWLMTIPGVQSSTAEITTLLKKTIGQFIQILLTGSLNFAGNTINIAMQIFLIIFLSGLAVVYAPTCRKIAIRVSTLPEECIDRFIIALQHAVRSIFLGIFFVAFIQGVLTGIGFFIFGVKDAAFWGLIAIICAVIPIVGTALIWVPVAITTWVNGSFYGALGIVIWGIVIVAGADNFLRPYCLKTGIKTSIIVLFFSIICSIITFGPIGLLLGPILVAFGVQAVEESDYLLSRYNNSNKK